MPLLPSSPTRDLLVRAEEEEYRDSDIQLVFRDKDCGVWWATAVGGNEKAGRAAVAAVVAGAAVVDDTNAGRTILEKARHRLRRDIAPRSTAVGLVVACLGDMRNTCTVLPAGTAVQHS